MTTATQPTGQRPRVVIVGSRVRRSLRRPAAEARPLSTSRSSARPRHHLFQPLLYQVATGILSEGEIAPATREILAGRTTPASCSARSPTSTWPPARSPPPCSAAPRVHPYDELIVAAGAGQSYFGNDQFAEFAPGMKSIDDALELRGRIFGAFELAELATDPGRDRPAADLRRRRRRPDRRGDGRPDRRAGPPHAASATSAPSTPPAPGSSCSTPRPKVLPPFGEKLGGTRTRRHSTRSASRSSSARWSPTSTPTASRSRTATARSAGSTPPPRSGPPACRPARWAGMLGEQSGAEVDRAGRVVGAARPHPARAPRGARGRRHDRR